MSKVYDEHTEPVILRQPAYVGDDDCEVIKCRICGKEITLWINGGECDDYLCCGYVYRTKADAYSLEVVKWEPDK